MHKVLESKITASHMSRNAYLYVRQSTIHQVFENTESLERQYALRRKGISLGWKPEQINVIDCDLGRSGSSSEGREGFQQLVTEVGMGRAGIVMGLEVSRLARNSMDWHRLLEMCALADTLILDEDGIYNPSHFNDRLLLGMKGTMSEAEIHILKARLQGGLLNKARRGELMTRLPIGFVYDEQGRVVLDPDAQVQSCIREVFQIFRRTGTASAAAREFFERGIRFPMRPVYGPKKGEVIWKELSYPRARKVIRNVRYAGVFSFGKTRTRRLGNGRRSTRRLPMEEWAVLIKDAHEGYISWDEYVENQRRLKENMAGLLPKGNTGPPREGPALLQGLIL
ncbi:MAG: recombinase family protein, partial [Planctomycetes bacterium]|nr:recombinase family protein [Planctomycetota bacterium]